VVDTRVDQIEVISEEGLYFATETSLKAAGPSRVISSLSLDFAVEALLGFSHIASMIAATDKGSAGNLAEAKLPCCIA